jgi:hypothetical protein
VTPKKAREIKYFVPKYLPGLSSLDTIIVFLDDLQHQLAIFFGLQRQKKTMAITPSSPENYICSITGASYPHHRIIDHKVKLGGLCRCLALVRYTSRYMNHERFMRRKSGRLPAASGT